MQTINNIVASFQYRASLKEIVIGCNSFDYQIPAWYCTDAIEKIVYNLLSNSIKHTKNKGYISLEIKEIRKNDTTLNIYSELFGQRDFFLIEIILKDTGIGIPKEYIDKIFDRFYQVESETGGNVGGSGIGLSIVKEMTEMHGGTIRVESVAGESTTFYIHVPVGKLNEEEINILSKKNSETDIELSDPEPAFVIQEEADDFEFPESEIQVLQKSSILVVEDDPDLKGYLISILLKEYNVYGASNGVEGLQIARNDIPDLIISDVMMPEMSGIELCKILKTDELTNHIPVILLTAKSSSSNIVEGLETGADDYITKPFESALLLARVSNLIKIRQQLQNKHRGDLGNMLLSITGKIEEDPFLNRATEVVEKMLMENIDGEMLAREMAMSLRQLYRKIEATTNQTVNEFIRSVQLKKGAQLLIEGKHNISEVCYLTGMSNPRYFSTLFKKQFGMTPSEFVKSKDELRT
jgi:DNA-binding response OmpR family regulator